MWVREIRILYGKRLLREGPMLHLKDASQVAALMGPVMEPEVVEVCYALLLTTKTGLIRYCKVSRGGISMTLVHPREIFQIALLANAASVVLVHNHPSGDPTPSQDDFAITQRVKEAGDVIGVELLDHVIIGHAGRYASIKGLGRL